MPFLQGAPPPRHREMRAFFSCMSWSAIPRGLTRPTPAAGDGGRAGLGGARACPAVAVLQLSAGWPAGGRAALRPPCPHGRQRLLGPLRPPVSVKQVAGWAVGVPQSAPVAHLSGSNRNQPHLSQFPASQRREEIEIQDQRSEEDPEPRDRKSVV